ncbi:MAG: hypothetical protein KDD69_16865 [Bdellovibrionales bacterium]|nr:hypothetical protein [Bdellovibrionales bacterium]
MLADRFTRIAWIALLLFFAVGAASPVEEADRAWQQRATLVDGKVAISEPNARAALRGFEAALERNPEDASLLFRVFEARYFVGEFVSTVSDERERLYDESVKDSEKLLKRMLQEAAVASDFASKSLEEQAQVWRTIPHATEAHFWSAINWGLWGMSHGYFASARKDVAGKIRDHGRLVILLDDHFADGGGYRLLGRLHTLTPRIPFFTGWVDIDTGITLLEQAYRVSRKDIRNALFLGEALLRKGADRQVEAKALLKEVAGHSPSRAHLAEESQSIAQARKRLAELAEF